MKYVCSICGYVYDEDAEGVPFEALPASWTCPLCGAVKDAFVPAQPAAAASAPAAPAAPAELTEEMKELSAGELAGLFSNLARGCEKQYQMEARDQFAAIADYFSAAAPAVPEADLAQLAKLVRKNLDEDYAAFRAAGQAEKDRGALRVCTWGEKVTRAADSLLHRYELEGDAMLQHTDIWICTVCGFLFIGKEPPALCPVCKVPSWKFEKIEGRA